MNQQLKQRWEKTRQKVAGFSRNRAMKEIMKVGNIQPDLFIQCRPKVKGMIGNAKLIGLPGLSI